MNLASRATHRSVGAALVFVVTVSFGFLSVGRLQNDHFVHLSRAFNVLMGDLPVRDFEDPGLPLMTLTSAGAMALFGTNLLTEVLLCLSLLGLAAALTFLAAAELARSVGIGLFAAGIQVAAGPRLYSYPKLLVHAAAVWLFVRYARRPTMGNAAALGVLTGTAFLFRHDHAVYVGVAAVVVVWTTHAGTLHLRFRHLAAWVLPALTIVLAYFAYVAYVADIGAYLTAALEFSAKEATRTTLSFGTLAQSPLIAACLIALPVVAGITVALRRTSMPPAEQAPVVGAIVLLILVEAGFLRDTLSARAPDVYAPASIVLAWLLGSALHSIALVPIGAFAAVFTIATLKTGDTLHEVYETNLIHVTRVPAHAAHLMTGLSTWPWQDYTPESIPEPLVDFIDGCTAPNARLLVTWFAPEIPFVTRRPFAAGVPAHVPGYYESHDAQQRALRRLQEHPAAIVLIRRERQSEFEATWPEVARFARDRYRPIGSVERGDTTIDLYGDVNLVPCFAARRAASSVAWIMLAGSARSVPAMSNAVP